MLQFLVQVVIVQVAVVGSYPTLDRLARRLDVLEDGIQMEVEFRREDVRRLAEMIEENDAIIQTQPECERHKTCADNKTISILQRAFSDEKHINSRTRRHVSELQDLYNRTATFFMRKASTSDEALKDHLTDLDSSININTRLLKELQKQFDPLSQLAEDIRKSCGSAINQRFASCKEIYDNGQRISGVYDVYPNGRPSAMKVYCDQDTDGGGWTVFQRREDGAENFYRNWLDYKHGFGNLEGEFWLGNEFLNRLTHPCCRELRIDMEDFENVRKFATYSKFQVGTNEQNYVVTVEGYSGDSGDSFSYHNGGMFSTKDRDNDQHKDHCAQTTDGAWWYKACHISNLNGQYLKGKHKSYANSVIWSKWHGHRYSLKFVEMKLR